MELCNSGPRIDGKVFVGSKVRGMASEESYRLQNF